MVNPSKKRQNEHTYGDLRKKIKKNKKSRVIVKEELNTEIQLNEPTTVSTLAEEVPVEVIPQESAISTQPSQGTSGAIMVPEATSNQLVIRDKNLPPLPPVSSLLLFTPSIEANKFDPFYQTVNTYVQHVLPNPMVNDSHPKETVKHEQGQTTPVIRQTMMDLNALPLMPIIPYYFHHEQFGIEACMHQLQQQRKKTGTIIGYTNTVPNGTNYYYHV